MGERGFLRRSGRAIALSLIRAVEVLAETIGWLFAALLRLLGWLLLACLVAGFLWLAVINPLFVLVLLVLGILLMLMTA